MRMTQRHIDMCNRAGACCTAPEVGTIIANLPRNQLGWAVRNLPDLTARERDELWALCGCRAWFREGVLHKADGPAVVYADGSREWYREGVRDREDGPAVEHADGGREWWHEGELDREDGPAIEHLSGYRAWYRDGRLLRYAYDEEIVWASRR